MSSDRRKYVANCVFDIENYGELIVELDGEMTIKQDEIITNEFMAEFLMAAAEHYLKCKKFVVNQLPPKAE